MHNRWSTNRRYPYFAYIRKTLATLQDNRVIIVGAGAAGMMAAIQSADRGLQTLLLEKKEQPGLKLRITGKGRCNLTNTASMRDFLMHIGPEPRFMRNSFAQLFNKELMQFFEERGVALIEERGGRIFPESGKSIDIFLALVETLERHPLVTIRKNSNVSELIIEDGNVAGIKLSDNTVYRASRVILATGGKSYPTTGSTGDGYRMARQAGHTIIEPVPGLVWLQTERDIPHSTVGFTVKNARLTLTEEGGKKISEHFGEFTFVEKGIDGPIVLSASRYATRLLQEGKRVVAHIDWKPALTADTLDRRIQSDMDNNGTRLFHDALRMWLPAEIIPIALKELHIEYYKRLNQIKSSERKRLLSFLKDFTMPLSGCGGFDEAIITQGGVSTDEINPKTMESKIIKGLYIVGELLNIDADTGGYNLQIAFSTGYAAGKNT